MRHLIEKNGKSPKGAEKKQGNWNCLDQGTLSEAAKIITVQT